jgi:hypothetical protein
LRLIFAEALLTRMLFLAELVGTRVEWEGREERGEGSAFRKKRTRFFFFSTPAEEGSEKNDTKPWGDMR